MLHIKLQTRGKVKKETLFCTHYSGICVSKLKQEPKEQEDKVIAVLRGVDRIRKNLFKYICSCIGTDCNSRQNKH